MSRNPSKLETWFSERIRKRTAELVEERDIRCDDKSLHRLRATRELRSELARELASRIEDNLDTGPAVATLALFMAIYSAKEIEEWPLSL